MRKHIVAGHPAKSGDCYLRVLSDGPVVRHNTVIDKATAVLHVDLAGPLPESFSGARFLVVGALHLARKPAILSCRPAKTKTTVEIAHEVGQMTRLLNAMPLQKAHPAEEGDERDTPQPRGGTIMRLHTDRGLEFMGGAFQQLCSEQGTARATTRGYDPKSNGLDERAVGLCKGQLQSLLTQSSLPQGTRDHLAKHVA